MPTASDEVGAVAPTRLKACRVVTTLSSARLLLRGQLRALDEFDWTVLSGDEIEGEALEFEVCHVPMRRDLAAADARSFVGLVRFFRRHPFSFVQTHTPKASLLGLPAAKLSGLTTVYTMHGSLFFRGNRPLRNAAGWCFEKWCCLWADRVLTQSREDTEVMTKVRICPAHKLRYIGNGIDLNRFTPQPPANGSDRPTVLMVSRLVAEKGCRDFFAMAAELRDVARFVHVGPFEADQRDAISRAEAEELSRAGTVEFVGEVVDVGPYVAGADVVVLPSYREGIPRAAMEAAAIGRPVVAYDIRGVREVIPAGAGLLAPLGDVAAITGKVAHLLADTGARTIAGEACRERVRTEFSEDTVFDRLRNVYGGLG